MGPVRPGSRVIEIGPSYQPLAPKASNRWEVHVIDHDTREGLIAKYSGHKNVNVGAIEDVDHVWAGGDLSDAVPAGLHGTFDAFVASHVIEHTPDLIGFLGSADVLLCDTGLVVLAVPDRRYCFDYFQPLTTTGFVLEAHAEARSRHTRRGTFDHFAYEVSNGGAICFGQHPSRGLRLVNDLNKAIELFEGWDPAGAYSDLHAWHFTPSSFELVIFELFHLGRSPWVIDRVTDAIGCEFHAWLRRGNPGERLGPEELSRCRLKLLKNVIVDLKAQTDWLLAGEPTLAG